MKQELRIQRDIDLDEFASVVRGEIKTDQHQKATGVCLDTRLIQPGDLFFAIRGARDGHEFVETAIKKGAVACVVSRDVGVSRQILVPDTLQALWNYAGWVRSQWGKKIVALSGSNGKTTTKEMMATLLGERTLKTPGTWNNFLGVPLTLLMLQENHDYGVVEMGISNFGELLQLCRFTKPNIAVLTNVGPAHLEALHDLNGVAKAKGEIFSQLGREDTAVLNIDDPRIEKMKSGLRSRIVTVSQIRAADVRLISKAKKDKGYDLKLRYGDQEIQVELPVNGEHNISNYLCALGVAKTLDISAKEIEKRTKLIRLIHMRMEEIEFADGRKIINDSYNANPASFQAGLQTVQESNPKRFLLLMGDMLELGGQSAKVHRDIGRTFAGYGVSHVFITGNFSKDAAMGAIEGGLPKDHVTILEKKEGTAEKILPYFRAGDILLVKGSRGMKLEEIVLEIQERLKSI